MIDFSFLTLMVTTFLGFGFIFGFLHTIWKHLSSQLQDSRQETKSEIQELRSEVQSIKTEIGNLRSEVKKDFHKLENCFDVSHSTLRNRIDVLIDSLAIRFINDIPRKKKRIPG
ncbi:hypothetical protein LEP1GSC126_0227 [Leptospira kirschneri str. 200801774]|uniref:hypothetical protein n=1 Tax=Leptospira kirschneri TaxID=29507 RepID=UPI0002BF3837|nr:hypothetical protein [Leptospira kirschneri]EMO80323.1 hypothetical protein LEP1GSC126_0227 [Leptospira kirschneri str. 200801774]